MRRYERSTPSGMTAATHDEDIKTAAFEENASWNRVLP